MVDSRLLLLGLVCLVGCGKGDQPQKTTIVGKNVPSSWRTSEVLYGPELTIPEPTDDIKQHFWAATKFQTTGEEKLEFELKDVRPRARTAPVTPNIQLIGIEEDMTAVREMAFHLVSAYRRASLPVSEYGFGPFGVSNDLYFGHTFWDMDVWMLPALLFLDPNSVKSIAKYRLDRAQQAKQNYKDFTADFSFERQPGAMMFPWESSVSGKEVCMADTKKQVHISGDVVWGLKQAEAMGLVSPAKVNPVVTGVQTFYDLRSESTNRGLEIKDVASPNEKFTGNNDLYTNLLAEWVRNGCRWREKPTYYLPRDEKSLLNYDDDPMRDYQQVAGLLSIYPLQYPEAEMQAATMMERFEPGLSPNGPAMGHSVIATIYARQGQRSRAYQAWKQSWKPYTKGPNRLFSERHNVSRTYFYTGAAGALNTVIYGFAGFRLDQSPLAGAKWTKKLKSGWWLSCKPNVPGEIGKIIFRGIEIDGEKFDFEMSGTGGFTVQKSD